MHTSPKSSLELLMIALFAAAAQAQPAAPATDDSAAARTSDRPNHSGLPTFVQAGSAQVRQTQEKLRERVSVLDFIPEPQRQAVIDRGGPDYDSAIVTRGIQACFDHFKKARRIDYGSYQFEYFVNIHFPAGAYQLNDTIVIEDTDKDTGVNLMISGDGTFATEIVGRQDWGDPSRMIPAFSVRARGGNVRQMTVRDMTIRGGSILFDTFGLAYATFTNLFFSDWAVNAIRTDSTGLINITKNYFIYGMRTPSAWAIQVGNTNITQTILIEGNFFGEECPYGIQSAPGSSNSIVANNQFVGPGPSGVRLHLTGGSNGWIVTGNQFSGTDRPDAIIIDGSDTIFTNNYVDGGIKLHHSTGVISNNVIKTSGSYAVNAEYPMGGYCSIVGNTVSAAVGVYGGPFAANTLVFGNTLNGSAGGSSTATYSPGTMGPGSSVSTTVEVADATLGDVVEASFSNDLRGVMLTAYVHTAGHTTSVFFNPTASPVTLDSGRLFVRVRKTY